jgi:malate dehydrogenase (oxaloacetate-decarboxylating)(NADP+)
MLALTNAAVRNGAPELPCGVDLLHDPKLNKGTAFTERERVALGLRGLLPPRVDTMAEQVMRVMENHHNKPDDLEKFIHLMALHDRNEMLFYRVLIDHIEEMMPIVYTPTVGKACQLYGHIFRAARGMFLSALDKGSMEQILRNWPNDDVRVIVVTDGERILGLGDLGANGMGIPIGKLTLYSVCAGVNPEYALPVTLDVGTDNEELLRDPLYLGIRHRRHRGEEYDEIVDEFLRAANRRWPGVLIQFEDFANINSFRLLEKYRHQICTFNDDIQGTAAVVLAGLFSALRITGRSILDQRVLFLGAGSAGIGIARLIAAAMREQGLPADEAMQRFWFFDSRGLVVKSRTDLQSHKREFAHDIEPVNDFLTAIRKLEPTMIIGASGRPGSFTQEMIEELTRINERPIVFALSNPTSKTECTAEQAYTWSGGRAVFASGSPFPPCEFARKAFVPGQGNNAYIFPAVGLGVIASGARHVTDEMLMAAAKTLAEDVSPADLKSGCIFPPLAKIRETSVTIAAAVAKVAYRQGLATVPEPEDIVTFVREEVFEPLYPRYV